MGHQLVNGVHSLKSILFNSIFFFFLLPFQIYGFAWMHRHERNVRSVELIHYVLTHPHDFYVYISMIDNSVLRDTSKAFLHYHTHCNLRFKLGPHFDGGPSPCTFYRHGNKYTIMVLLLFFFKSFPPAVKMCRRLLASAHCVSKQFAMKCVIVPSNQWTVDYTTIDGKGERIYIASIVA